MNNLPILSSTPQTAAKPAPAANMLTAAATPAKTAPAAPAKNAAAPAQATATKPATAAAPQSATEDGAAQGQSFNEVLARQVSGSTAEDDTAQTKKITAKSADEIFADIKGDTTTVPAAPAAANLPAEMLAAMLPQGMNIDAKTAAPSDAALPGQARAELTGAASGLAKPTDPSAQVSTTELGVGKGKPALTTANTGAQIEAKKDASFASMMDKMTATATAKLAGNDEKTVAAAAAPQPNAAALAAMQAPAPLTPANMMPAQVTINTPVDHEKWGDEFNQKITWLAGSKDQTAELHLNPPQLGPMDVVLKVSGDQATALFTSPHAAVREAIEQALPKLREMMADSGIMLGNATVSDQAPRERQGESGSRSQSSRAGAIGGVSDSAATGNLSARVSQINRHNGIVDTFA
jgi:flagellar hook-length control protein FliK